MAKDQRNKLRLEHIFEAVQHIADFLDGVSKEDFMVNYEKQSAVVRQLEIIGEAAGKLTRDFTKEHSEVDWPKVVGMRHKIIHDYFDIDVDIVWTTAIEDVPSLKRKIENLIKKF